MRIQLGSQLHISRGIGTAILPVRFACRPELVLVTPHDGVGQVSASGL